VATLEELVAERLDTIGDRFQKARPSVRLQAGKRLEGRPCQCTRTLHLGVAGGTERRLHGLAGGRVACLKRGGSCDLFGTDEQLSRNRHPDLLTLKPSP